MTEQNCLSGSCDVGDGRVLVDGHTENGRRLSNYGVVDVTSIANLQAADETKSMTMPLI